VDAQAGVPVRRVSHELAGSMDVPYTKSVKGKPLWFKYNFQSPAMLIPVRNVEGNIVWKFNVQIDDEGFLSSHHVRGKPSPGRFLPECPMVP
jgi:hypothetical protein